MHTLAGGMIVPCQLAPEQGLSHSSLSASGTDGLCLSHCTMQRPGQGSTEKKQNPFRGVRKAPEE